MGRIDLLLRRAFTSVVTRVERGEIVWEAGTFGKLADGNCTVRHGKTTVFAAAVCAAPKPHIRHNLALQVDYREASVQRLKPWIRREMYGEDRQILISRAIDRSLRPLLPQLFSQSINVTVTTLATDPYNANVDVAAIHAASGALICSDIPWNGPVGACKVAQIDDDYVINPSNTDLSNARLILLLAATKDRIVTLESEAKEASIESVYKAMDLAYDECQRMVECQRELHDKTQVTKRRMKSEGADATALVRIMDLALPFFEDMYSKPIDKKTRAAVRSQIKKHIDERLLQLGAFRSDPIRIEGSGCVSQKDLHFGLMMVEDKILRDTLHRNGNRPDGRLSYDLRPISCRSGILPVVHGSGFCECGETEVFCTATVGNDREIKAYLDQEEDQTRRLLLSYRIPPYAVNETAVGYGQTRTARGHSMLAERAIAGVMPSVQEFPFPVKIIAETMASNGSSSMATVCGGVLAAFDASIPVKSLVAGISIGLVTSEERRYAIYEIDGNTRNTDQDSTKLPPTLLIDPQDIENFYGDMDFKIAGTEKGLTAMQLDVMAPGGLQMDVVKSALNCSKKPLHEILGVMETAVTNSERTEQPQCGVVPIDNEAMGFILGKDGMIARRIEDESGSRLIFSEEDYVSIYAPTPESFETAKNRILDLLGLNIHEGEVYSVKVVRVLDHGAYVELPNGFQALLHISQLSHERIGSIEEIISEGQYLNVKCIGKDESGIIKLSRKVLLDA